jgi:GT2 family glycosyltransferase
MERNVGAAGSWNSGLEFGFNQLGCNKIIVLNNDSLLLPDTIDRIVDDLDRLEVGIASPNSVSGKIASPEDFFKMKNGSECKYEEKPDFSCFGINKNCFDKVGLFDEAFYPAYFEDNDYHYRMRQEKLKAVCNFGNHYYHFGSRTCQKDAFYMDYVKLRYVKNREYYVSKWGGEPGEEKWVEPFNGNPPGEVEIKEFEEYQNELESLND